MPRWTTFPCRRTRSRTAFLRARGRSVVGFVFGSAWTVPCRFVLRHSVDYDDLARCVVRDRRGVDFRLPSMRPALDRDAVFGCDSRERLGRTGTKPHFRSVVKPQAVDISVTVLVNRGYNARNGKRLLDFPPRICLFSRRGRMVIIGNRCFLLRLTRSSLNTPAREQSQPAHRSHNPQEMSHRLSPSTWIYCHAIGSHEVCLPTPQSILTETTLTEDEDGDHRSEHGRCHPVDGRSHAIAL